MSNDAHHIIDPNGRSIKTFSPTGDDIIRAEFARALRTVTYLRERFMALPIPKGLLNQPEYNRARSLLVHAEAHAARQAILGAWVATRGNFDARKVVAQWLGIENPQPFSQEGEAAQEAAVVARALAMFPADPNGSDWPCGLPHAYIRRMVEI